MSIFTHNQDWEGRHGKGMPLVLVFYHQQSLYFLYSLLAVHIPCYFIFPQQPCYLQVHKMWRWKPINGHSSTAQSAAVILLVGTWRVILVPSEGITLYLACWLREDVLPGALSQMKGPISLRFLPPRHSISQHFTVLLMRHIEERAAVVKHMGGVTASQPSSLVGLFRNGARGICMVCSHRLTSFFFFCWLPKIALEYVFTSHTLLCLICCIHAVRMAAAVTSPLQTSAWTPEVPPTPCPSHTLQGVNQTLISDFWLLNNWKLLYFW